jgi:hypothetical protein
VGYAVGDISDGYVAAVAMYQGPDGTYDTGPSVVRLAKLVMGDSGREVVWKPQEVYEPGDGRILDLRVSRDLVAWLVRRSGAGSDEYAVQVAAVTDFDDSVKPQIVGLVTPPTGISVPIRSLVVDPSVVPVNLSLNRHYLAIANAPDASSGELHVQEILRDSAIPAELSTSSAEPMRFPVLLMTDGGEARVMVYRQAVEELLFESP